MTQAVNIDEIDYTHDASLHSVTGAQAALEYLFKAVMPTSVLDIGCGTGSWLKAAQNLGVADTIGVDGIAVDRKIAVIAERQFVRHDLRLPLDLNRRFDLVICVEVAEHLDREFADTLIDNITRHADRCLFSGACPGQGGTHHVNCQWPEYWQDRFNARGFSCSDKIRWDVWSRNEIEPWYRQNMFVAERSATAGSEPRLLKVVHYDMLPTFSGMFFDRHRSMIEEGALQFGWYTSIPVRAGIAKLARFLDRRRN
jgi:SAM-dependent methyltransferase